MALGDGGRDDHDGTSGQAQRGRASQSQRVGAKLAAKAAEQRQRKPDSKGMVVWRIRRWLSRDGAVGAAAGAGTIHGRADAAAAAGVVAAPSGGLVRLYPYDGYYRGLPT